MSRQSSDRLIFFSQSLLYSLAWGLTAFGVEKMTPPSSPTPSIETLKLAPPVDVETRHLFGLPPLSWSSDPFRKKLGAAVPVTAEDTEPVPVLEAVLSSRTGMEALISGRRVRVGDEVGTRSISEIGENYVLLENSDSTLELALPPIRHDNAQVSIKPMSAQAKEREAKRDALTPQDHPPERLSSEEDEEDFE